MNCPKADKLSQYVDQLLTEKENNEIAIHIKKCRNCSEIIELFKEEEQFIKDTLQIPSLPNDFDLRILNELESYQTSIFKKKPKKWRSILQIAVAFLLLFSLSAYVSPSFANFISGMFGTNQVDKGLQNAAETGMIERIAFETKDQGLILQVEDIIVDSARVAVSIQVKDAKGNVLFGGIDISSPNDVKVIAEKEARSREIGFHVNKGKDYTVLEVSGAELQNVDQLLIQMNLVQLGDVTGKWSLEVPIDLSDKKKYTKTINLEENVLVFDDVQVDLKKFEASPSGNTLYYRTSFSEEGLSIQEEGMNNLSNLLQKDHLKDIFTYSTAIAYRIEDEYNDTIYKLSGNTNQFNEGHIMSSGRPFGAIGQVNRIESFFIKKPTSKMNFVLEGIIKVVPSNFSIPIHKGTNSQLFNYKGIEGKISNVEIIEEDELLFQIELEGTKGLVTFDQWVLTSETGSIFRKVHDDLSESEEDFNRVMTFKTNGLTEIPASLTLHLISEIQYIDLEHDWKVPLY